MKKELLFCFLVFLLPYFVNSQSDTTPPQLEFLDILTDPVDIENGTGEVRVAVRASDDTSGVSEMRVSFTNGENSFTLSTGNVTDGETLQLSSTPFNQYSPQGTYEIDEVSIEDFAGNNVVYYLNDIITMGFETTFEVVGGVSDTTPPQLEYFDILNDPVNINNGLDQIKVLVRVSDDVSGVSELRVSITSPNGEYIPNLWSNSVINGETLELSSTPFDKDSPLGTYKIDELSMEDFAGNHIVYYASDLSDLGFKSTFEVQAGNDQNYLTYVPDDNFEQRLINMGYDDILDDYVVTAKIDDIEYLNVSNMNILDLTGIENFQSLTTLSCFQNRLTILDLSKNKSLEHVSCWNNELTNLDTSTLTNLKILNCESNQITSLDLTNNPEISRLTCGGNKLTNLDVSALTRLNTLWCSGNQITSLDVSQNPALTDLKCGSNQITDLNLGQLSNLTSIHCSNNKLTTLDVSLNKDLSFFYCEYNQITELDVSVFTKLDIFGCSHNEISKIDLTKSPLLRAAHVNNNKLTDIDVSNNPYLRSLQVSNNQLSSLDVSQNIEIWNLWCDGNKIFELYLSNNANLSVLKTFDNLELKSLDVRNGNNSILTKFEAYGNPSLQCIQVDNESDANTGNGVYASWQKDEYTSYSEDCDLFSLGDEDNDGVSNGLDQCPNTPIGEIVNSSGCSLSQLTYVPDDNFEQALIDLGYDDVLDDYVPNRNIENLTDLVINNKNISDLTGIEGFEGLINLQVTDNIITSLDFSQNTSLIFVDCRNNFLSDINLKQSTSLKVLIADNNKLTDLDVSNNIDLRELYCKQNLISSIDVSNNNLLTRLIIDNNELTNLDVSQNDELEMLHCYNNNLTNLNVTGSMSLIELACNNNQLTDLDVSQNNLLEMLACNNNQLTELDVSQNSSLQKLYCPNNPIGNLDLSKNSNLIHLDCAKNNLTNIDVSKNPKLEMLIAYDNEFKSIDISINEHLLYLHLANNQISEMKVDHLTKLDAFWCEGNQIESLDLSNNPYLVLLTCFNNPYLESVNVKNGNNGMLRTFDASNNPALNCIQVDDEKNANEEIGIYSTWLKDNTITFSEDCSQLVMDDDQDGVDNEYDLCPETPIGAEVDANGCVKSKQVKVKHYPNPFLQNINFAFELPEQVKFKVLIYNQWGLLVKELNTGNFSDDKFVSTWFAGSTPDGIYFYKLIVGDLQIGKGTILKHQRSGK